MAKRKAPAAFTRAVTAHRERLEKVLTAQNTRTMSSLYEEAQGGLLARMRKVVRAGRGDTFTAHQQRVMLVQLRQGQAQIAQRMAGKMGELSLKAQKVSLNGLVDDVARLSKAFTGSEVVLPVAEAATFRGVIQGRHTSLLAQHDASMNRYGAHLVGQVEKRLSTAILTQDPTYQVMDEIADTIGKEWYWGERIVRTETARAYAATTRDGIEESSKDIPELMQQWQEHCDASGAPLDDRVAVDSLAMHGQCTPAGGVFTMPPTAPFPDKSGDTEVPDSLVGLQWEYPPNRPNDRAVISPWMPDWGVPGWIWRGGRRVPL